MFKGIKFTREDEEYVEKEYKFLSEENPDHYRICDLSLPKFALFCKKLGYYPDLDNFGKWQLNLRCEVGRMDISIWSVGFSDINTAIYFYRKLLSFVGNSATNTKSEVINDDNV